MASEEQRLVATLCLSKRVRWSVDEVGFDDRGAAVLEDWLTVDGDSYPSGRTTERFGEPTSSGPDLTRVVNARKRLLRNEILDVSRVVDLMSPIRPGRVSGP